ncbi:FecR family protein [bacterium]|nr:FecR family protein [bacterium]
MKIKRLLQATLIVLLSFTFANQSFAAAKAIAVVLSTKGKAEVKKGDAKWADLKFGSILDNGDKLRTGDEGFIALAFTDDKSQLKIRPSSEVTLNADRNQDFSLAKSVNMQIGELFVDVKKQKGSLQVATPTSVASVKGTEFWVIVGPDGESQVLTLEGIVELLSRLTGIAQDVIEGMMGEVDEDGNIEIGEFQIEEVPDLPDELLNQNYIEIDYLDQDGNEKRLIIEFETEE